MTTSTTAHQDMIDNLKNLAVTLTHDATHKEDPRQRALSARWLGQMKYDDGRAAQEAEPRSAGHEFLYQAAIAKLPIVDAFIDTANAQQLRHVLEGMVHGLNVHTILQGPDSTPDPEQAAPLRDDPDAFRLDSPTMSPYQDVLLGLIAPDFNQTHDPELRRRTGRGIGRLKYDKEHGLRTSDGTSEVHRCMASDATRTLAIIDQLIATADADQLRAIIAGFAEDC